MIPVILLIILALLSLNLDWFDSIGRPLETNGFLDLAPCAIGNRVVTGFAVYTFAAELIRPDVNGAADRMAFPDTPGFEPKYYRGFFIMRNEMLPACPDPYHLRNCSWCSPLLVGGINQLFV